MGDTSYVSLSLKKYNELYDKAKAYDEMLKKLYGTKKEENSEEDKTEDDNDDLPF